MITTSTNQLSHKINHVGRVLPKENGATDQWSMGEHSHAGFHELIYVVRGTIETRIRGVVLTGNRGDMLLYPQGESHIERAIGEEPLETVFLGWNGPIPINYSGPTIPLLVNDRAGRIQMLVEWIAECIAPQYLGDYEQPNYLLTALLFEYARLVQPTGHTRVQKARHFIRRHLSEPIDLERLANEVGLSKYHFSREFKRLTGQAPMAMLRSERVAAARSLLLSTPWKLHVIARQVGFTDEYQLSRVFKRETGISPGKVR